MRISLTALVGICLAYLASKVIFVGSGKSLIVWAIVGFLNGYFCSRRSSALLNGSIFGFALAFTFMVFSYNGAASLLSRLPFFAILGVFGMICGLGLAVFGYYTKIILVTKGNKTGE